MSPCVPLALFLFELLVLKSLGVIRSGQKSERGEQRDCRIKERRNDQGDDSSFYQFWNLRDPNYRRKKKATVVQNALQKTLQSEQLQKYLPRLAERHSLYWERKGEGERALAMIAQEFPKAFVDSSPFPSRRVSPL